MAEVPLRIRNYSREDLDDLYRMDRVCFPDYIAFSRWELASNLSHPKSIARVAETPGKIVGFVLARVESHSIAHIITLDVLPEARRQKIGTELMRMMHQALAEIGITSAVLEVSVANIPAQRLYEKLRYRRTGTLPGYYQGIEDAYQLEAVVR